MLCQIFPKVMFKSASIAELTFCGGKLWAVHPGSAESHFVARSPKVTSGILAFVLLPWFPFSPTFTSVVASILLMMAGLCSVIIEHGQRFATHQFIRG